jgi:hypothetical protein
MNPFDRADLGKTRAADHEATHLGTLRSRVFLLRQGNIVAYSGAVGRPCGDRGLRPREPLGAIKDFWLSGSGPAAPASASCPFRFAENAPIAKGPHDCRTRLAPCRSPPLAA